MTYGSLQERLDAGAKHTALKKLRSLLGMGQRVYVTLHALRKRPGRDTEKLISVFAIDNMQDAQSRGPMLVNVTGELALLLERPWKTKGAVRGLWYSTDETLAQNVADNIVAKIWDQTIEQREAYRKEFRHPMLEGVLL